MHSQQLMIEHMFTCSRGGELERVQILIDLGKIIVYDNDDNTQAMWWSNFCHKECAGESAACPLPCAVR